MFLTSGEPHTCRKWPPPFPWILELQDFPGNNSCWGSIHWTPDSIDPPDAISFFILAGLAFVITNIQEANYIYCSVQN